MQAINKLILGTVQFGLDYGINNSSGRPSGEQLTKILDFAYQKGVRILDTAEAYGNAHELIGDYHAASANRFEIITRFSPAKTLLPTDFRQRVAVHLHQLGTERLYAYMFHSVADLRKHFDEHFEEIDDLKRSGLIGRFGVSVYTNKELEEVIASGKVDLIQLPFNLLDNFSHRGELLKLSKEKGIEIHARSVFLQGLFFMETSSLPGKLNLLKRYLDQLLAIAAGARVDLKGWALSYALKQDLIDRVVIGIDSVDQLREHLDFLNNRHFDLDPSGVSVKERALLNPARWKTGKVLAITQARMGSTRLPGKVLRKVGEFTVLELHLRRLFKSETIDQFIVATTTEETDAPIVALCENLGVRFTRGSMNDVLDRYYQAAAPEKPEWVVRVTSDCPLIDPAVVDATITTAIASGVDYCSNTVLRTFPDGMDVEVMKFTALEAAWRNASLSSEREHVTPYIYNHSTVRGDDKFSSTSYVASPDYSGARLTVDTAKDLEVIDRLVSLLGPDRGYLEYTNHYLSDPALH